MKFEFCGHVNCPEWFISEISVLTKIVNIILIRSLQTAVKTKLVFSQLILHFLENSDITVKTMKLLNGTGLDFYEIHSVIATLKFILENSVAFSVDEAVLNKELIDLGLPKQNVEAIIKTFKTNRDKLLSKAADSVLKGSLPPVQLKYSIHEFIGSSNLGSLEKIQDGRPIFAQIQLKHQSQTTKKIITQNFIALPQDVDYLIYEAERALECLEKIERQKARRKEDVSI